MNAAIRLLVLVLLACAGCSDEDAGAGADAGQTLEASSDATPDALPDATPDVGCATDNGALACGKMVDTMCARFVQCCATASCSPWADSVTTCKAEYVNGGLDCSEANYATASVCSEEVQTCMEDVPLVACSDLTSGTANWPQSCKDLWTELRGGT